MSLISGLYTAHIEDGAFHRVHKAPFSPRRRPARPVPDKPKPPGNVTIPRAAARDLHRFAKVSTETEPRTLAARAHVQTTSRAPRIWLWMDIENCPSLRTPVAGQFRAQGLDPQ